MLLCLRGTPVLYQGDEIGLGRRRPWPRRTCATRSACGTGPPTPGGTPCGRRCRGGRARAAGSPTPGTRPWLPSGDPDGGNVEAQRADPGSVLALARDLIALRRRRAELQTGAYQTVTAPAGVWAWLRGTHTMVVLNMSEAAVTLQAPPGHVHIGTDRRRDGEAIIDTVSLCGWEGVVAQVT